MITRYLPILLLLLPFVSAGREPIMPEASAKQQAKPLAFIQNKGQIVDQYGNRRNSIDAKLAANGITVFVGDGAIHYQWSRETGASRTSPLPPFEGGRSLTLSTSVQDQVSNIEMYRMDVELVGANKQAIAVHGNKQGYFENYYLPQCPDGAVAYSYNTITYKNVYPGIDWVLYSKNNQLKYDFVVHAGGDAKQIKLRYKGATSLSLKDGAVIAETPFGSITEQKPYSYDAATRQELASAFVLTDNELSFNIAGNARSIVIDPALEWATYYGGLDGENGHTITLDSSGNVYMAGNTSSTGNISTIGAHQTTLTLSTPTGSYDAFLVKFNPAGVRQWGTYYGGTGGEEFNALAFHESGFIYAAGRTTSSGSIATAGAHQTNLHAINDAFIVKFNTSGQRQWGTYYGGEGQDYTGDVTCDKAGNIYLVGVTHSDTGISTPGSAQPVIGWGAPGNQGATNAFMVKFSPAGSRQWGTYFGNNWDTEYYGVACDTFGGIYAVGAAWDSVLTTPGSFQPISNGWEYDALIVKYNSNGTRIWSTLYGGGGASANFGDDWFWTAACQGTSLFIAGKTNASNWPASPGAYQTSWANGTLVKFDTAGKRDWGTFFGPATGGLIITGLTLGPAGNFYISGYTGASSGFATSGAWQTNYGGGSYDLFFSEFTFNGTPRWTSYYGGTGNEGNGTWGHATAYDLKNDRLYFVGNTTSTSGVATSGSHQSSLGGGTDALLVKFRPDTLVGITEPVDTLLCVGDSLKVIYKCVNGFYPTNTFTVQLSDANGSFANPVAIGSIATGVADTIDCVIPMNTPTGNGYRVRIVANGPAFTSDNNGDNIRIINLTSTVASSNSPVCAGSTLNLAATGTTGAGYTWAGPSSYTSNQQNPVISNSNVNQSGDFVVTATLSVCSYKDTVAVIVKTTPTTPTISTNNPVCAGGTLNLSAVSNPAGADYQWMGPNLFISLVQNPSIAPVMPNDAGVYSVQAELNGCTSGTATVTVVVNTVSSLVIYPSPNDTICTGSSISFVSVPMNAGSSPTYQWYNNGVAIPGATSATYTSSTIANGDSIHCVMTVTGVCSDPLAIASGKIGITVLPLAAGPTVTITADPGLLLSPWQLVKFTAVATNAGPLPKYQWKRNGQDVIGAMSDNWSANNLSNGDTISCVVTSSVWCATPASAASNRMVVNIKTGIEDIAEKTIISLYPNPNDGSFVVRLPATASRGGHMRVDVVNAVGQAVYTDSESQVTNSNIEVNLPASVANGVYLLKLQHETGTWMMRFTVAR